MPLRCPLDRPDSMLEMSNLDHSIDEGLEDDLRNGLVGTHSAWEFNGTVWFEDEMFHEEVWRYHFHIETVSAPTLRELMKEVNDRYGWE